ncbi:MAG: histidine kinase dimerization/phosphoacceptor domain -containing protein [Synechococcus sp.]|nr:histidine kinase dimerization/phosphoacceptor domain -containing protein [Synechococcus sp.]
MKGTFSKKHIIFIGEQNSTKTKTLLLEDEPLSIGRHSSNAIVISNNIISRQHCLITPMKNHATGRLSYWMIDGNLKGQKSKNGVFINGKKQSFCELTPGDTISLAGESSPFKLTYSVVETDTDISYEKQSFDENSSADLDRPTMSNFTIDEPETSFTIGNLETARLSSLATVSREDKYYVAFKNLSQGILFADVNSYDIIEANPAFCSLAGYSEEELTKLNLAKINTFDAEFWEFQIDRVRRDKLNVSIESMLIHKDGFLIEVEANISLVELPEESFLCYSVRDTYRTKKIKKKLAGSLKSRRLLLRELQHRVRNNLLVASSLLEWQCEFVEDPTAVDIIKSSQRRINLLAIIYEAVQDSPDISTVDISQHLDSSIRQLDLFQQKGDRQIKLNFDLEAIAINIETFMSFALIVVELIDNALRYAFVDRPTGQIFITCQSVADHYRLVVKDDGVGFPEDWNLEKNAKFGLQLVALLAEQIQGDVYCNNQSGAAVTVNFKNQEYTRRF